MVQCISARVKDSCKLQEHQPPSTEKARARCKSLSPVYGTTLHTSG